MLFPRISAALSKKDRHDEIIALGLKPAGKERKLHPANKP
jgi:hypothetical protein